jgi:hypothetical protein
MPYVGGFPLYESMVDAAVAAGHEALILTRRDSAEPVRLTSELAAG